MSDIRVYPGKLSGSVVAPPSKSMAHRALICAALAHGKSTVSPLSGSEDIEATSHVLRVMGAKIDRQGDVATVRGGSGTSSAVWLDCKESGSTLRFLLPVAAALGIRATFFGQGRLPARPIGMLTTQLALHDVEFTSNTLPLTVSGRLTSGVYFLPGDVSSQFVSGLLFALPLLPGDSEISLLSPLESAGYVDMTIEMLSKAGIEIERTDGGYHVSGNQSYRKGHFDVEGDYSSAAFWLCAGALGGEIAVNGLAPDSVQGDREILDIIRRFGSDVYDDSGAARAYGGSLAGCRVDVTDIPDLLPIMAVMAALSSGDTELYNAARLRGKESDRLATVTAMLRALGGSVEEFPDRLVIHGGALRGGEVDGAGDHRIVMSAAIAALCCTESVVIHGTEATAKSYPEFFDDLRRLGGNFDVI